MYLAAVNDGRTRTDPKGAQRVLTGWLEKSPEQLWVDVQAPTADELQFLGERFGLHPLAVEECDHTGVRPKIEEFENHLFIVLHGINHNEGEEALRTVEFKFFLWRGHLISVHDKPSTSIRAAQERLQRDPHLLPRSGADTVLHLIVDAVIDHYFPLLEALENRLEKLEGEIFRNPSDGLLEEIFSLQRQVLALHRIVHPQLDILGQLASGRYSAIDAADVAYFRDVYDHLQRINDRVQIAREMLHSALQCYLSQASNRMSSVMKGLAVLATVALPASILTSLFGMQLQHIPGAASPETFWMVAGGSILLSIITLVVLRSLKWL